MMRIPRLISSHMPIDQFGRIANTRCCTYAMTYNSWLESLESSTRAKLKEGKPKG